MPSPTVLASPTATGPANQRQVCVVAFQDQDGDGLRGIDERFLAGVILRLTHLPSGVFDTWTTDGANDPDHCWSALIDGAYRLEAQSLPPGLVASGQRERLFHRHKTLAPLLPRRLHLLPAFVVVGLQRRNEAQLLAMRPGQRQRVAALAASPPSTDNS